jgi:hypothetical protein
VGRRFVLTAIALAGLFRIPAAATLFDADKSALVDYLKTL